MGTDKTWQCCETTENSMKAINSIGVTVIKMI